MAMLGRLLAALLLGVMTVPVFAWLLLLRESPLPRETTESIHGNAVWLTSARRDTGRTWIVLERVGTLFNGPIDAPVTLADWMPPPPDEDLPLLRIGHLAVGWPWPAFAATWEDRTGLQWLPPPIEIDDDGQSMNRASAELRRPAGWARVRVLARGAALDAAVFILAWWIVLTVSAAVWRARRRATAR